ncbi:GNAT family N-acetyltransferase [Mesorhizobium sp. SP-1A]|uniref:GNAT family N-acetyltransferase n=1 Tax=Mesorhizobium sp. SP-1A TaxID=3077840 RepID=UPI0028F73E0D|nr:GNAT family N-acetyltransferase [Mesorhizobium sp. SP-1A]
MAADSIPIRPLTIADAVAYRRLRLAALIDSPEAFSSSPQDEEHLSDAEIAARAAPAPPGIVFGAFMGGELSGMAVYLPDTRLKTRHKGTMVGVYVAPALRGTGTGRRLVEHVVRHAATQGVILQCVVAVGNEAARRLYRSLGFQPYGLERDAVFVNGRYFDDELLALDLRHGQS